ncbi:MULTISPECIES: TIGR00304 family membrane protein [unclassified Archaeoglobus]|uniref:TIGR00304 family membrane protein n=1 Tax=unclassified Archaeoglobus TaxID=2643606 RepID=UPI0025B9FBED|nr:MULTISPECIES: TIGR00304 family protein [unclassified Archaeoglobus]
MIAILAAVIIILGLYLIFTGLREEIEIREAFREYEDYEADKLVEDQIKKEKRVKGGGVILIGPIPIVFGDSKYAVISLILAIVLMLLSIALLLLMQV